MLLHTWVPQTLRAAGLKVVETSGWTNRSHGSYPDKIKIVWHHDASPPGDSPGALNWMLSSWPNSSANIWLDRYGTWHMVGTGVSWHAGRVLDGMPDNFSSLGIETDHTTAEAWPAAQLDSLRRGTAALLNKQGVGSNWLHFHKSICSPVGRKSDPDGLSLGPERAAVAKIMAGGSAPAPAPAPKPKPVGDDDLPLNDADKKWIKDAVNERLDFWMPRALNVLMNGQGNQAFPKGSTLALDGKGLAAATADAVWNEVLPAHADGKSPEKSVPGGKARDTIAGIFSTVMRILN